MNAEHLEIAEEKERIREHVNSLECCGICSRIAACKVYTIDRTAVRPFCEPCAKKFWDILSPAVFLDGKWHSPSLEVPNA